MAIEIQPFRDRLHLHFHLRDAPRLPDFMTTMGMAIEVVPFRVELVFDDGEWVMAEMFGNGLAAPLGKEPVSRVVSMKFSSTPRRARHLYPLHDGPAWLGNLVRAEQALVTKARAQRLLLPREVEDAAF